LVSLLALSPAPAADGWLGLYLDNDRAEAAVVEVIPDSPAAKAGLRPGDVLLAIDDQAAPTREAFIAALRARQPGDQLKLRLRRGEAEQVLVVELGVKPATGAAPSPASAAAATPERRTERPAPAAESAPVAALQPQAASGATVAPRGYLGLSVHEIDAGIVVDRVLPNGPAAAAGLKVGDQVLKVGERHIGNLMDLDGLLQQAGAGTKLLFMLRGQQGTRSVWVTLGERPRADGAIADATVPAPVPVPAPAPAATPANSLEAEVAALRAELQELRQQLEALRRSKGRE
jgi:serine protease Do